LAQNRDGWQKVIEEAKVHHGLYCQRRGRRLRNINTQAETCGQSAAHTIEYHKRERGKNSCSAQIIFLLKGTETQKLRFVKQHFLQL
jgi:hypothetical protein